MSIDKPSLENAVAGNYDFGIKAIFAEAWAKTEGIKKTYWAALFFIALISIIVFLLVGAIDTMIEGPINSAEDAQTLHPLLKVFQLIISIFLTTPLFAGVWMIAIRHVAGIPVTYKLIFNYFRYWTRLWIYPTAFFILTFLGGLTNNSFLSLVTSILSMILIVTFYMYIPLIVEKNLSIQGALTTSQKAISHHWFKMLWFIILLALIAVASLCTLGIALIWTLPWMYNAIAILYRNMFGVQIA